MSKQRKYSALVNINLTEEIKLQLLVEANNKGLTVSDIIRLLILEHFNKKD